MKKIFLLSLFMPVAMFAQNGNNVTLTNSSVLTSQSGHSEVVTSIVKAQPGKNASAALMPVKNHQRPAASAYVPATVTNIGTTVYDLQTNGALAKRLQLYSGGMSYVWIKSDDVTDPCFTTRYSGYNYYNGSSWISQYGNTTPFESARCGWPSIGEVTTGGTTYEMLTSHYAQAGQATYAGGIFWYKNSGVGEPNFTRTVDLSTNRDSTSGLLWPRMATSNNRIYMIGTYEDDRKIKGVYNPIVYFCYNTSTARFESKNITLPGYDSSRYGEGSADEYAIDARGQYVAIVTGGYTSDLALWKSSDSGKNFTKTIVNNYAAAPFNPKVGPMFLDTAIADDGTCSVTLDGSGVAHVSYTPVKEINTTLGDSFPSGVYLSTTDSIIYWNDKDQKKIEVGGCVDYDHTGAPVAYNATQTDPNWAGYGRDFASFSNIAVDASGNVFVVFSAPHVDDQDDNGNSYRHVYCSVYNSAKGIWLPQQDIVQTWQLENIYATVAPQADSKLHLVFMQHNGNAGIFEPATNAGCNSSSNNSEESDTMVYEEVSTTDLLNQKVGLIDLGINENMANNLFSTGSIYPNPAADELNLSLNLTHSASVSVVLYNMLGQQMEAQNYNTLPSGANTLQFEVNSLQPGVYLCNISAGGYTTTERVVIER